MKTKTIDVWVNKDFEKSNRGYHYQFDFEESHDHKVKATLTYEVEEPKVEITPSQLEEVFRKRGTALANICSAPNMDYRCSFWEARDELFGELDE